MTSSERHPYKRGVQGGGQVRGGFFSAALTRQKKKDEEKVIKNVGHREVFVYWGGKEGGSN